MRHPHTFARLRGYGLTVVPYAPFVVQRIGDGATSQIAVTYQEDYQYLVDPSAQEHPAHGIVADIAPDERTEDWVIDVGPHSVTWPNHHALHSDGRCLFDLLGRDGRMITLQGPFSPQKTIEQVVGPGQHIIDRATADEIPWIRLGYTHEGVAWEQEHALLPNGLVVSTQSPADDQSIFEVAWQLAGELLS